MVKFHIIGIDGAHGGGKTTTLRYIESLGYIVFYDNYIKYSTKINDEMPKCIKIGCLQGFFTQRRWIDDWAMKIWSIMRKYEDEHKNEKKIVYIFTDRTPLSAYVYYQSSLLAVDPANLKQTLRKRQQEHNNLNELYESYKRIFMIFKNNDIKITMILLSCSYELNKTRIIERAKKDNIHLQYNEESDICLKFVRHEYEVVLQSEFDSFINTNDKTVEKLSTIIFNHI
jgi:predicted ATPase